MIPRNNHLRIELFCPRCGYPQRSGSPEGSTDKLPSEILPYTWVKGEVIVCANCGFMKHAEWWTTLAEDVFFEHPRGSV